MYGNVWFPVMYPGHLGDQYTSQGTQTLRFRNSSNYFKIAQKTKMQTEKK